MTVLSFSLAPEAFLSWGWRIPFLVGGPLGLVGLYLRLKLSETPAFEQKDSSDDEEDPGIGAQVKETFARQPRARRRSRRRTCASGAPALACARPWSMSARPGWRESRPRSSITTSQACRTKR